MDRATARRRRRRRGLLRLAVAIAFLVAVIVVVVLLIRGCGRADFQNADPGQLHDSITRTLFTLPDDTVVYPGHDYKGRTTSTIGEEKRWNPRLPGKSRDEFIAIMNGLGLPPPRQLAVAVPANRACGAPPAADEVQTCCRRAGIERHSAEHSLGFWGAKDRLPEREILEFNTMCGHGMVSFNFVRKMIEYVKLRRLTPKKAARIMAKCCECGAFNPVHAEVLLEKVRQAKR